MRRYSLGSKQLSNIPVSAWETSFAEKWIHPRKLTRQMEGNATNQDLAIELRVGWTLTG
jgi:hypothetical protein